MKKSALLFLFFVLSGLPSLSYASDEAFYTTFSTGLAMSNEKGMKDGFGIQSGFGWKWFDFIRTEFTVEYSSLKLRPDDGGVKADLPSWRGMATGYVDLFSVYNVTPFIGAGVGVSKNHAKHLSIPATGEEAYRMAWKAIGGVGISLPKNLVLDVSYSYTDLGRYTAHSTALGDLNQDLKIRQVLLGLRYNF